MQVRLQAILRISLRNWMSNYFGTVIFTVENFGCVVGLSFKRKILNS